MKEIILIALVIAFFYYAPTWLTIYLAIIVVANLVVANLGE